MNKFNFFRIILDILLFHHILYLGLMIFILINGGVIFFAHPLLPIEEWGSLNLRTALMQLIVTIVSFFYICYVPRKQKVIEKPFYNIAEKMGMTNEEYNEALTGKMHQVNLKSLITKKRGK